MQCSVVLSKQLNYSKVEGQCSGNEVSRTFHFLEDVSKWILDRSKVPGLERTMSGAMPSPMNLNYRIKWKQNHQAMQL